MSALAKLLNELGMLTTSAGQQLNMTPPVKRLSNSRQRTIIKQSILVKLQNASRPERRTRSAQVRPVTHGEETLPSGGESRLRLMWKDNVYFVVDECGQICEGPFCPLCLDDKGQYSRVKDVSVTCGSNCPMYDCIRCDYTSWI